MRPDLPIAPFHIGAAAPATGQLIGCEHDAVRKAKSRRAISAVHQLEERRPFGVGLEAESTQVVTEDPEVRIRRVARQVDGELAHEVASRGPR